MSKFLKTYGAVVVSTADPEKVGRLRVRIPTLHGLGKDHGYISDADLPWALPEGLQAGNSSQSGGVSWIPVPGDQVWVRFLDENASKLVWSWGNQNTQGRDSWGSRPLHSYESDGKPTARAALSRYEHWLEFRPWGIDVWTKTGYHFEIVDEQEGTPSGRLTWRTPEGFIVSLDDKLRALNVFADNIEIAGIRTAISSSESVTVTTAALQLDVGKIEIGGDYKDFELDLTSRSDRGFKVTAHHAGLSFNESLLISASSIAVTDSALSYDSNNKASAKDPAFSVAGGKVGLGKTPTDPVVRLSDLLAAMRQLKRQFDSHVHKGVRSGGGVSGTPTKPAVLKVTGSSSVTVEGNSKISTAV